MMESRRFFGFPAWCAVLPPLVLSAIGLALWWRFGFEPLNDAELPLATFINGLTGRNETIDWLVIFFNRWWGEAVFVVIAFAAYALFAASRVPKPVDWRRILMFAGFILVVWVVCNEIGDEILEKTMPRNSPSLMMGEPFVDLSERYETRVKTEARSSFPSNHGTVFFTLFFICLMRFGKSAWELLPLCIFLSLPRVFTGAHWLSDTLIGSVLVTWVVAAIAVRTPLFGIYRWVEETICQWWDQKLTRR
jgi:membrane-associated phospholipid phosphatase